jgi:hypothetical protein
MTVLYSLLMIIRSPRWSKLLYYFNGIFSHHVGCNRMFQRFKCLHVCAGDGWLFVDAAVAAILLPVVLMIRLGSVVGFCSELFSKHPEYETLISGTSTL